MSTETIAAGQLRAFVERIERVEEEIKSLNADKSDIYTELRGVGFDVKAVRRVVAARKLEDHEREENDAIFDLYWSTLNGDPPRVHVHEAKPKPKRNLPAPQPPAAADGQPSIPTSLAGGAKSEALIPVSSGGAGDQPAFIDAKREEAVTVLRPRPEMRPHCQNKAQCAGVGFKHCYPCEKAAGLVEAA